MDYRDLYLAHHGIKGQKWGIRRYQNEDGTRTEAAPTNGEMNAYEAYKKH